MQLLVYTVNITCRKEYIFNFLLEYILGIPYQLTNDINEFSNYDGPKFSYSTSPLGTEIHFLETPLLSETGITITELTFINYDNYEVPFPIDSSLFPFDIFAASFYLVSRYEEYLNPERDNHGRFEAKSSLAFKHGFLARPVVDEWAFKLLEILKRTFPETKYKIRNFVFQPTLDIDNAYYIKSERFLRRLLKTGKLILTKNWRTLFADPFDVYQKVKAWDKKFSTKTMFFILMNNKHLYDSRESKKNKLFKDLVPQIGKDFVLGLHPSYLSNENKEELSLEKADLEEIISERVYISRHHYLKLLLPDTYKALLENNIKEDYTMVYADLPGFRASTCSPFLWYNLSEERVTNLFIQPTAVMDQTLRRYMNLSANEAIEVIRELMQNVKSVQGTFVSLWHNESISDFGVWKGWEKVYIEMLKMSKL